MQQVVASFEQFIRRAVAPSVSFLVILLALDLLWGGRVLGRFADAAALWPERWETALGVLAVLLLLGLSYLLNALSEAVFHNLLQGDFATWCDVRPRWFFRRRWLGERAINQQVCLLRERVQARIRENELLHRFRGVPALDSGTDVLTDRLLYEIVGGIDRIDTRRFTDEAKATGVVAVSLGLVILLYPLLAGEGAPWWECLLRWLGALLVWLVGREAVRIHYRTRALRHYVNFLAMPDEVIAAVLTAPAREAEGE